MINFFFKNKTHKISDVLSKGKKILKKSNIETFDIDAKVLLSFVSNIKPYEFISNPKKTISNKLYKKYIKFIKQRSKNKPIALITGEKEFYGINFKVSKSTLIPRPDSETLIDAVKNEFKDLKEKYKIFDMGTGSGCLLLTLLNQYKNSIGIGIDIQKGAIKTSNKNIKNLSLEKKAQIFKSNWYKPQEKKLKNQKFDIIISNPPYITKNDIKTLDKDVKNYEPFKSLCGGIDGLNDYRQIAKTVNLWNITKKGTKLFLEIGISQEKDVIQIFKENSFKILKQYKDLGGITRILSFEKK